MKNNNKKYPDDYSTVLLLLEIKDGIGKAYIRTGFRSCNTWYVNGGTTVHSDVIAWCRIPKDLDWINM
jgi:hypothetical protein